QLLRCKTPLGRVLRIPSARGRCSMIRRRHFLALLAGVSFARSQSVSAQSEIRTYRVGLFNRGVLSPTRVLLARLCSAASKSAATCLAAISNWRPEVQGAASISFQAYLRSLLRVKSMSSWQAGTLRHLQLRHESLCRWWYSLLVIRSARAWSITSHGPAGT